MADQSAISPFLGGYNQGIFAAHRSYILNILSSCVREPLYIIKIFLRHTDSIFSRYSHLALHCPPTKLLKSGVSTPYTLLCWICTIWTKLLSDLHQFEWSGVDIRWFSVDGIDTRWIPRRILCGLFDSIYRQGFTLETKNDECNGPFPERWDSKCSFENKSESWMVLTDFFSMCCSVLQCVAECSW